MQYKNCIFDLYGTLVDIRTDENAAQLWEAMSTYYGERDAVYCAEELRKAYFDTVAEAENGSSKADSHESHPEIQLESVFQKLFQAKGVNAGLKSAVQAGQHFRDLSTEYIRLYDGAKELLRNLREQGCGVWLLSNAQSIFTMRELEQLGMTEYFDGIYLSSDYGVKKPDRHFFNILLQERSIAPETAIMIGNDGICDIQGGRETGLATFYLYSNLSPDEPLPAADYVLDHMNLSQVERVLLRN